MISALRFGWVYAAKRGMAAAVGWLMLAASVAPANNIRVTNVGPTKQDTVARTANVTFDLAWDNSWRDGEQRDAAWVFVKFRAPGSNEWEHAILSTNSALHKPAADSVVVAVPDGRGAFIYSSTNHTGSVSYARTKLNWQYGSNGYDFAVGAVVEVSVHAVEMVYIPAGAFYLGSGGGELSHFYRYTDGVQTTQPYLVSSETGAITVGMSDGNLYYDLSTYAGDRTGIISNAFPKGYAAFYCMKYELSQGQYKDFLNKLTGTQWSNRYETASSGNRYTISGPCTNSTATAPDRACNYLSWADWMAYADWAALRPMTELEYEKACRGPAIPVTNEYAWGSTNITPLTAEAGNVDSGTSTVSTLAGANCCYDAYLPGPTRVGIFATTNSTRQLSGAGYYGVMELSGNMWERSVTVGHAIGRGFQGTHGDGVLAASGNATNNADWPGTDSIGGGYRGGNVNYTKDKANVSDRSFAAIEFSTRNGIFGSRAVRAAP